MANNAPGKALLKVTGILYIVFGTLSFLRAVMPGLIGFGTIRMSIIPNYVFFAERLLSVLLGIMAILYCGKIEKAFLLRILVVFHLVLLILTSFADMFMLIVSGFWAYLFSALLFDFLLVIALACLGLVVPILAWVGVERNAKAYKNMRKSEI